MTRFSLTEKNREDIDDVMFPDEFCYVLMQNEPKVLKTSSDVSQKSSAN